MADKPSNLDLVRQSVRATNLAVLPGGKERPPITATAQAAAAEALPPDLATAYDQSVAKAVQSIGQTTAIVIQDAGDMLRNVSTVEVTAIGAATAAWIATKQDVYKNIIEESVKVINDAADTYLKIGQNAYAVLSQFKS